jgi:membrane-anchored protein YejM (alkaline phosphatase superfamily)
MQFKPYCIVLHLWGVHYPYPNGYEWHVREFIKTRIPLLMGLEDTLVVLTADHGELLGEHGRWKHNPPMTKELQEVPLVIYPVEKHKVHETIVESIQILPTILDMFGIEHKLKGSILND